MQNMQRLQYATSLQCATPLHSEWQIVELGTQGHSGRRLDGQIQQNYIVPVMGLDRGVPTELQSVGHGDTVHVLPGIPQIWQIGGLLQGLVRAMCR